jgi:hypothetical protein
MQPNGLGITKAPHWGTAGKRQASCAASRLQPAASPPPPTPATVQRRDRGEQHGRRLIVDGAVRVEATDWRVNRAEAPRSGCDVPRVPNKPSGPDIASRGEGLRGGSSITLSPAPRALSPAVVNMIETSIRWRWDRSTSGSSEGRPPAAKRVSPRRWHRGRRGERRRPAVSLSRTNPIGSGSTCGVPDHVDR